MDKMPANKVISIISFAFLMIFLITGQQWLLWLSMALLLISILNNSLAIFIATCWMRLGSFIATLNSRIILFLVFYVIVTPLAFLYRLFSKAAFNNFRNRDKKTYFNEVNYLFTKDSFEKTW